MVLSRSAMAALLLAAAAFAGVAPSSAQEPGTFRHTPEYDAPRGWLGFYYSVLEDGTLLVKEVLRDSPAHRAGLQPGDTIVAWNGRRDVKAVVGERRLEPGDSVRIRVRRGGGRDRDVVAVAGQRPAGFVTVARSEDGRTIVFHPDVLKRELRFLADSVLVHADSLHQRIQVLLRDSLGPRLRELENVHLPTLRVEVGHGDDILALGSRSVAGAEFTNINPGLSAYFGTDAGALVLKVAPQTPAARAGLQPGDVVVEAGGTAVASIADLRHAFVRAQRRDSSRVPLEIIRKGTRRALEIRWD